MMSLTHIASVLAYEDMQRAGYPLEAEDALTAWEHGATYEPASYMDLPRHIRREIDALNAETPEWP